MKYLLNNMPTLISNLHFDLLNDLSSETNKSLAQFRKSVYEQNIVSEVLLVKKFEILKRKLETYKGVLVDRYKVTESMQKNGSTDWESVESEFNNYLNMLLVGGLPTIGLSQSIIEKMKINMPKDIEENILTGFQNEMKSHYSQGTKLSEDETVKNLRFIEEKWLKKADELVSEKEKYWEINLQSTAKKIKSLINDSMRQYVNSIKAPRLVLNEITETEKNFCNLVTAYNSFLQDKINSTEENPILKDVYLQIFSVLTKNQWDKLKANPFNEVIYEGMSTHENDVKTLEKVICSPEFKERLDIMSLLPLNLIEIKALLKENGIPLSQKIAPGKYLDDALGCFFQRITRYPILLSELQKNLGKLEQDSSANTVESVKKTVQENVNKLNSSMPVTPPSKSPSNRSFYSDLIVAVANLMSKITNYTISNVKNKNQKSQAVNITPFLNFKKDGQRPKQTSTLGRDHTSGP